MNEGEIAFNFLYILLLFGLIYPPQEFFAAGFTIESLFSSYLGAENILFVQYHINRSCLTLLVHSLIPIVYFIIYYLYFGIVFGDSILKYFWIFLSVLAVILPVGVVALLHYYKRNNWQNHPICQTLQKYSNSGQNWNQVALEINNEFRRNDKLVKRFSSITKIIATENWIMKTGIYFVHFAHQSDTALIAVESDSHSISIQDTMDSAQFVNIQVKPTRAGVRSFSIRINSLDFKDLQDRINRPIVVLSSVKFHTSLIDRFVDVFVDAVGKNDKYQALPATDTCFACMSKAPDVKIDKRCDQEREQNCSNCFCRPMWCCTCLARWFATRQNENERESWLRNQASCPMCRARFCILDVCFLDS